MGKRAPRIPGRPAIYDPGKDGLPKLEMQPLAECYAGDLFTEGEEKQEKFVGGGPNWLWCMEHATFSHKEACEFIVHLFPRVGYDAKHQDKSWRERKKEMRAGGCTKAFLQTCEKAREKGAHRILFYA